MRSLQKHIRDILIAMFLTVVVFSFSFTTSYADWYGLTLLQPSAMMTAFSDKAGEEIDIVKSLSLAYTFESNVNPRQSSAVTNGFTFLVRLQTIYLLLLSSIAQLVQRTIWEQRSLVSSLVVKPKTTSLDLVEV